MFSIIYNLEFPTFCKNLCEHYCSQLSRHKFLWIVYFKMLSWYELAIPISYATSSTFSFLYNIVRSLKRNLDDFQVHLLDELQYRFNVIGVTETKITEDNPKIPGYSFEYVPKTLDARGFALGQQNLSFAFWILAYSKKTLMNRVRSLLNMHGRLLAYSFEPRPKSPCACYNSQLCLSVYQWMDARTRKKKQFDEREKDWLVQKFGLRWPN